MVGNQERRKRSRIQQNGSDLQRHESGAKEQELPREEVIRRLRLLGQPITLFGEVTQIISACEDDAPICCHFSNSGR